MQHHDIKGGGSVRLHVVETGNPGGRTILFIHGFSQCWRAWNRQLSSNLADDFRLVAMDLRGHGLSERPRNGYGDSKLWADDVNAVIEGLGLERPVLSGWSYGPLIILDYIRYYGEDRIGAINFIGGITKLGSDEALSVLTPEFLGIVPGFFSSDVEESVRSLDSLLGLCFAGELSDEERYLMLGYNVSVPPFVREEMFARSLDNDDIMPRIRKPVLITHGANDLVVRPAVVNQHKAGMPHAEIDLVPDVGHVPFWNQSAAFNSRLKGFAENLEAAAVSV
jgi:non-heme chloroperoxidase